MYGDVLDNRLSVQIHKKLVSLWAKCKSNQYDVMQHVATITKEIETSFLDNDDNDVEAGIQALENIAAAKPTCYAAADELTDSHLFDSIVNALIERSIAGLVHRCRHCPSNSIKLV
jgi:hypothetical protein